MTQNCGSVLITAILGEPYATDHYGNFRSEGRIPINIGFGLMELGYDVNIVYEHFKDLTFIKSSDKGRVVLSKSPIKAEYDFQLFWDRIQPVKSKKQICIINYTHEIERFKEIPNVIYVTPYNSLTEYMQLEANQPVEYLPQINPITAYNIGFKDFNCDITNKQTINIFVYISSWEKITLCIKEFAIILERIKYLLNSKGHKVKLFIQVDSMETRKDCRDLLRYGDYIEFVGKYRYDNYLRMIEDMDVFILKGNQFTPSAGMYDILALGKPLLYVSENVRAPVLYRNPLFKNLEEIIISGSNERNIKRKVDSFIKNPERLHTIFKDTISDSDFNKWKEHATKLFSL